MKARWRLGGSSEPPPHPPTQIWHAKCCCSQTVGYSWKGNSSLWFDLWASSQTAPNQSARRSGNWLENFEVYYDKRVWRVHLKFHFCNFFSLILSLSVYLGPLTKITCRCIFYEFLCDLFTHSCISWSIPFCSLLSFANFLLNIFHSFEFSRPLLPYSLFFHWKS